MLTLPSTLAPDRLMLAVVAVPRGSAFQPLRDTLSEGFRRFVALPPYLVGYNGSGKSDSQKGFSKKFRKPK